jgi:AraC-like DNA-binding protein
MTKPERAVDLALDSGFGDVSNFNHAFRAEFGVSPRSYCRNACNSKGDSGDGHGQMLGRGHVCRYRRVVKDIGSPTQKM